MNRRDFAKSAALAAVGVPAAAALSQSPLTSTGTGLFGQNPAAAPKRNDAEYAICRVRGHIPTAFGTGRGFVVVPAVFHSVPDRPSGGYSSESSTNWETCFYCGRQYRFVTKIEEK
jgi:hypothetical protein